MKIPTKATAGSVPSPKGYVTAKRSKGNYVPNAGRGTTRVSAFKDGLPAPVDVRDPEKSFPQEHKQRPSGTRSVRFGAKS